MNIHGRYKKLNFWNKLAVWGTLASILGLPVGIVAIFQSGLTDRPEVELKKALQPVDPSVRSYTGDAHVYMAMDGSSQKLILGAPVDNVLQPFGPEVPIWFCIRTNGLFVSAAFRDGEGKLLAELHDNLLTVNPNNTFRTFQNQSSIEVLDQYGVPVLQLQWLNQDTYRFGGVIRADGSITDGRYGAFPQRTVNTFLFGSGPNAVVLIGKNRMITNPSISGSKEFAERATEWIPRWFGGEAVNP